ncbi:MAG TPA: DUF2934 domain-containing protein [Opitutus sp.]|nr:DUF2934 domain-containing protein [Opitutus sp.]
MNETTPSLSSVSTASRLEPTHEEIARRAQDLWEKYGRPSGRDQEIWLEAERSLQLTKSAQPPATVSQSKTAPMPAPEKKSSGRARGGRATAR